MLGSYSNDFNLVIDSQSGVRPATNYGTSITPGNNAYGSYTQVLSATSDDAYGILINFNSIGVNTTATDCIATVGIDTSGGTSYLDWIVDLLCSCAMAYTAGPNGVEYYFPLFIPAGSSLAVKMSMNNATPPGSNRCFMRLYCQPSRPELLRVGSQVRTYGSVPASSCGTAVTSGTTSEGTYVSLGTIAAGDNPWYWQVGLGLNNAAVATLDTHHVDLAVGQSGAKKTSVLDQQFTVTTAEQIGVMPNRGDGYSVGASGEIVYARCQCSGSALTGTSVAAYGVI